jgi:hypothetical protein
MDLRTDLEDLEVESIGGPAERRGPPVAPAFHLGLGGVLESPIPCPAVATGWWEGGILDVFRCRTVGACKIMRIERSGIDVSR